MPGVQALPSTKIPGGTCAAHCDYPASLVKTTLPELGTKAAFPGGSLTTPWYRSALIVRQNARLLGMLYSNTESSQVEACERRLEVGPTHKPLPLGGGP